MLDYTAIRAGQMTLPTISAALTPLDLHHQTDFMLDTIEAIIADATDADVVFTPLDPQANDTFGNAADANIAWTLGHVVLHAAASSEEGAALACEMARGIAPTGRSRFEPDWQTVTTIQQVRERLTESRHMRHALLNAWPVTPHLEVTYEPIPAYGPLNATSRFLLGLSHEASHLDQLREIMRQARAARA